MVVSTQLLKTNLKIPSTGTNCVQDSIDKNIYVCCIYIYIYIYISVGATNEAIFQTSFRVLLFSREVFETMKFTKLL